VERADLEHGASMGVTLHDGERGAVADGPKFDLLGAFATSWEGRGEGLVSDPTRVESDQVVRTGTSQAQLTLFVDRATQSSARPSGIRRRRRDRELSLHAGNPLQVLRHQRRLPRRLRGRGGVLEIASATAPGVGERARRGDALGAGLEDLHSVATREVGGRFGDLDPHELAGQAVAHEDHPPVGHPPDAAARGRPFDANGSVRWVRRLVTHRCSLLRRLAGTFGASYRPQHKDDSINGNRRPIRTADSGP
jgi:hypothetical protein